MPPTLDAPTARRFADLALGHVTREFPHKLDHLRTGSPDDTRSPRELHPAFFGSFDWHSCVHAHWLLAFLSNRFDLPDAASHLRQSLTDANLAAELAYARRPESAGFERPYGWAWAMKLATEAPAAIPLAQHFAHAFRRYLADLAYPIRAGTHTNTAFAALLALDYAQAFDDTELTIAIHDRAVAWFNDDVAAPRLEPDGNAFLSPTLTEAALMRRALPPDGFDLWLARFLPDPSPLLTPATVSDRADGQHAHLDGLNLTRAWTLQLIDPQRFSKPAAAHRDAAMPHLADHYAGSHWLATFALLALTPHA